MRQNSSRKLCTLPVTFLAFTLAAAAQDKSTGIEVIPANEADAVAKIVSTIQHIQTAAYSAGERPALRDAHAKAHGCVKATFRVVPNLPDNLRRGVFAKPVSFPAWIRFSNGNGTPHDDHSGDGRGMAIKLLGVEGPKLLADEQQAKTQDFVMINYPVFFIRNAADYVAFTGLTAVNKANEFFATHPHEAEISAAISAQTVRAVFEQRYFSMTPYLLGSRPIKFSAVPVTCSDGSPIRGSAAALPTGNGNYLRSGMVEWLKEKDACFHFAVQLQTDPVAMPVEDPTIRWEESKASFVTVADIRIPKQTFDTPAQNAFCENLSYTPWHSLAEHRPLGGINRVRQVVYAEISKMRHGLNKAPRAEPTGDETF